MQSGYCSGSMTVVETNFTMNKVSIIKRNGKKEKYDPEKIRRVLTVANFPNEKMDILLDAVSDWVQAQNKSELSSLVLRDQIQRLLNKYHKPTADLYEWYQKTKE